MQNVGRAGLHTALMDRRHTHTLTMPGEQIVKYKPQETAYLESNIGVGSQVEPDNNNTEKVMIC